MKIKEVKKIELKGKNASKAGLIRAVIALINKF